MKNILLTIGFAFVFLQGFTNETFYNKIIETESQKVNIQIIPKLELFHIMAFLSNSMNLNRLDFIYKADINKYFEPYKNNTSLQFIGKVMRNYHAQPLINGLFVNQEFFQDSVLLKFLDLTEFGLENNNANRILILDSLIKTVDFYAKLTNYDNFLATHEFYYKQKIEEVKSAISYINIVTYNEEFWGLKKDNYRFIICMLDNEIHSYWYQDKGKSNSIFFITPKFIVNNDAVFGNSNQSNIAEGKMSAQDYIFYGAGHELGHCFFNPIADNSANEINKIAFKISTNDPSKEAFLCESMLRSLTAYFMIQNNYSNIAQMVLQMEKQQGFIYNELILELIKDYNNNRSLYKNYCDYMPVMLSKLNEQIK